MSLKIEKMCERTLNGTLDGMIPVRGEVQNGKIRIRIGSWVREFSDELLSGTAGLRYAAYAALARYRTEQKITS